MRNHGKIYKLSLLICQISLLHATFDSFVFSRCNHMLVRPLWNLCLTSANHLLLVINASINFLIYCSIGKRFKSVLKRIFLKKDKEHRRSINILWIFLQFFHFPLSQISPVQQEFFTKGGQSKRAQKREKSLTTDSYHTSHKSYRLYWDGPHNG